MDTLVEYGKIRVRLLKLRWIIPSTTTKRILYRKVKDCGVSSFNDAITTAELRGFVGYDELNDRTSRFAILYLTNLCKKSMFKKDLIDEKAKQAKEVIDRAVKDVLDE